MLNWEQQSRYRFAKQSIHTPNAVHGEARTGGNICSVVCKNPQHLNMRKGTLPGIKAR